MSENAVCRHFLTLAAAVWLGAAFSSFAAAQVLSGSDPVLLDSAATQPSPSAAAQQPTTAASGGVIQMPNQPPTPGVTGDWFGERTKLGNDGLTVAAAIYYDYSENLQGGLSTSGDASRELTDLDITYATEKYWHGGIFFVNFLNHEGTDASHVLVGDAQGFDNQDGPSNTQLYQVYYQQLFADDKLRFKIGRIDSTTDFAYTANGSSFIGSTFGFSPAITSFPTYPDPAAGAVLFWTPNNHFYATGGIFLANQADRFGIIAGRPFTAQPTTNGEFLVTELGEKWTLGSEQLPGRLGIGGYHDTGDFTRFDGTTQSGASGMYGVFDQTLWQVSPPAGSSAGPTGLGVFAQYGLADGHFATIDQHIGSGFAWTGPIPTPSRSADVLGLGASYAHFSSRSGLAEDYELEIETFYKLQITPWFNIQPDLQYIINPGGTGLSNACVATIRVELDF